MDTENNNTTPQVVVSTPRARALTAVTILVACLVVLVSLLVLFIEVNARNDESIRASDESARNGQRINNLTAQVDKLNNELLVTKTADVARERCLRKIDTLINRRAYELQTQGWQLVVELSQTPPGTPNREAQFNARIQQIQDASNLIPQALDIEAAYTPDVPAEPCPTP